LRHVIPTGLSNLADVVENPELVTGAANERLIGHAPFSLKLARHRLAGCEAPELFLAYFSQPVQVRHLFLQVVIGPVKPVASIRATLNAKRPTDCVSELAFAQLVMLGEDLNAFGYLPSIDQSWPD
jgi:hypothetical protein